MSRPMSLAQDVSSTEGVNHHSRETPTDRHPVKIVKQVLSYDAFTPSQIEEQAAYVAAYKVSTLRKTAQVLVTVIACWLASGIVFGFAALKPVLVSEGVYRELCTEQELLDDVGICVKQDLRLNLFFTLASITTNISALPVGAILDRYGPQVCGLLGSLFLATGSILMYFAFAIPGFDAYMQANFFLALGGTFIFVPSFHMANAFPKSSGTIVALITGSFDASAAVFLFYRLTYQATNHHFTPDKFFLIYTLIPILILISQLTVLPSHACDTKLVTGKTRKKLRESTLGIYSLDELTTSDEELACNRLYRRRSKIRKLDGISQYHNPTKPSTQRSNRITAWAALHNLPAHRQMLTPIFILLTLLTILQMLRMNYFIATIRSQYIFLLSSPTLAQRINQFFDIALPVAGVACTPFIGCFLDRVSLVGGLEVIVGMTVGVGVLGCVRGSWGEWAAYGTVGVFVVLRPLFYSALSDYTTKIFGFATFGAIYGSIICLSGIVNLSQYELDSITLSVFNGDPTPVNIAFAVAALVVGGVLVVYVRSQDQGVSLEGGEENEGGVWKNEREGESEMVPLLA